MPESQISTHFHYLGSVSRLHIHYTHVNNLEEHCRHFSRGLLEVIQNIEIKPDYYQSVDLIISPLGKNNISLNFQKLVDIDTMRYRHDAHDILESIRVQNASSYETQKRG